MNGRTLLSGAVLLSCLVASPIRLPLAYSNPSISERNKVRAAQSSPSGSVATALIGLLANPFGWTASLTTERQVSH